MQYTKYTIYCVHKVHNIQCTYMYIQYVLTFESPHGFMISWIWNDNFSMIYFLIDTIYPTFLNASHLCAKTSFVSCIHRGRITSPLFAAWCSLNIELLLCNLIIILNNFGGFTTVTNHFPANVTCANVLISYRVVIASMCRFSLSLYHHELLSALKSTVWQSRGVKLCLSSREREREVRRQKCGELGGVDKISCKNLASLFTWSLLNCCLKCKKHTIFNGESVSWAFFNGTLHFLPLAIVTGS